MEVRLGNIFGFSGGNYAGNVYDQNFMCPTLNTMQGGCKQPMIIENIPCATSRVNKGEFASSQDLKLINVGQEEAGTILSRYWKGIEGDHSNAIIVAMRGRNPDNPSDRTVGAPTEQRLEPNSQGLCNTLTSVQKDNLVMESVKIKKATKDGYAECKLGGVADLSFPNSTTRRGRVQDNGDICPTLMAGEQDICRIETQYRIRKLTPMECWRLMDFTDEDFHKAEQVNSNTQLYKQAGNSICKNVLVAIFGQMLDGKEDVYKEINSTHFPNQQQ